VLFDLFIYLQITLDKERAVAFPNFESSFHLFNHAKISQSQGIGKYCQI